MLAALVLATCMSAARAQDAGPPQGDQKRVDLSANQMRGEEINGEQVRMLIGDVRLRQDETVLRADRATQYPRRDEILFEGNVIVFERGDTLRSRSVLYNRATKVGRALGNVRLTDGDVDVTAPSATYYTSEKRTTFDAGVTLVDSVSVLTSDTGTYWSEAKRAEFAGNVALDGTDTDVRADSLTYLREDEISIATGNVYVESFDLRDDADADTTSRTVVVGGWAFTDDPAGLRRIRDDVFLFRVRYDSTDTDTLVMRSATLESTSADSIDLITAAGDVRIWNTETSAVSDSVAYVTDNRGDRPEVIRLFGRPMAWFGATQVSGDSLIIRSTGGSIDTLWVRNNTMLADRDSTIDRIHQVSGRNLLGLFQADDRRDMIVGPMAEAVYYLQKESRPDGAVRTSADRIVFELEADELKRIRVEDGVEGTYYQEDLIPSDLQLAGFRWAPERRPRRQEMLADPRLSRLKSLADVRPVRPPRPLPPVTQQEARPALGEDPVPSAPPDTGRAQWAPGAIDVSRRGYTIVVASRPSIKQALDLALETASSLSGHDLPVDVLKATVDQRFTYRVVVGQFSSRSRTSSAIRRLAGPIPPDSWILPVTADM